MINVKQLTLHNQNSYFETHNEKAMQGVHTTDTTTRYVNYVMNTLLKVVKRININYTLRGKQITTSGNVKLLRKDNIESIQYVQQFHQERCQHARGNRSLGSKPVHIVHAPSIERGCILVQIRNFAVAKRPPIGWLDEQCGFGFEADQVRDLIAQVVELVAQTQEPILLLQRVKTIEDSKHS